MFGNTASEPAAEFAGGFRGQWWLLDLKTADRVQISWENPAPAERFLVEVYTAETTDATLDNSRLIDPAAGSQQVHSGGVAFAAPASGGYPVLIGTKLGIDGPYSLLARVMHKALVFVPSPSQIRLKGSFVATVRDSDGKPITDPGLQLRLLGIWKDASHLPPSSHVLATASPKNGVAAFPFKLPRKLAGTVIRLRVVGGGPDYQNVASATRPVRVARS